MSFLIPDSVWANYEDIINGIHEDFNQDDVIWERSRGGIDRDGEDNKTERFTNITLKALFQYNQTRVWPLTRFQEAGLLDKESEVIILNIKYLRDLGYINANGNFDYNQDSDRFVHKGIRYKSTGDTPLSQAKDKPLLVMIILTRESLPTAKKAN